MIWRPLLAALLWAFAFPAWATIALVTGQTASNSAGSGTTLTISLPNNPTAGNFVVVPLYYSVSSTVTMKDANNNTYSATTNSPFNGTAGQAGVWFLANAPANASLTINITFGSAQSFGMAGYAGEFSGVVTTTPLERDATGNGAAATHMTVPSVTTTNNGDLLVASERSNDTPSTANSPWTQFKAFLAPGGAEWMVQSSAGAQAIDMTQGSSSTYGGLVAAFKAAATTTGCAQYIALMGVGC